MPHFTLDCSQEIINLESPKEIIQKVYDTAEASGLFTSGDIKVRINLFEHYSTGNTQDDFIHVFANIMEGRTTDQKAKLSKSIVGALNDMFPNVPIISMNIRDFEKASYCNKGMINEVTSSNLVNLSWKNFCNFITNGHQKYSTSSR